MRMRSVLGAVFGGIVCLIVVPVLLWLFKTGPVFGPLPVAEGIPLAKASDMPGVSCDVHTMPVKLSAGAWFRHDVVGDLCRTDGLDGKTLAVTVSGAGYGSVYWDFPYRPDTYSFVRAALKRGLVTFNFDRLGMGRSDRPFGLALTVDNHAYVLKQIIGLLRELYDFDAVVTVGHSFGSTISLAHALTYPQQVDGLVLTGFVHNSNPGFGLAMRDGIDFAAFKGPFAGAIIDPTYIISKPDTRGDIFYTADNTDPMVIEIDERTRETTTLGEIISTPTYFREQSKALTVPAFTMIGEDDFVVCGGAVECTDHKAIIAWESEFFPPAACHEIAVLEGTNHNANLHLNAAENFESMLSWIERRVGIVAPPENPCISPT